MAKTQNADARVRLILYSAFVDGKLDAPKTLLYLERPAPSPRVGQAARAIRSAWVRGRFVRIGG